jgi:hypothetical protein
VPVATLCVGARGVLHSATLARAQTVVVAHQLEACVRWVAAAEEPREVGHGSTQGGPLVGREQLDI